MPIYASFTFPLAIGSTALIKYSHFIGLDTLSGQFWHQIGLAEMAFATIVVSWVLIMMTKFVFHNVLKASHS